MKVFLDTNVLVSAVAARGLCADVLRAVIAEHQLIISPPLLVELRRVLKNKLRVPTELIEGFVAVLQQDATTASASIPLDVDIQDKDDLVILSSALDGGSKYFITGDNELLELIRIEEMEILSPRMFWEKLKGRYT